MPNLLTQFSDQDLDSLDKRCPELRKDISEENYRRLVDYTYYTMTRKPDEPTRPPQFTYPRPFE